MHFQTENEFQQAKIKDLNDKYNVTMFTTNAQGGKPFAVEQKIRELKKRISKIKAIFDQTKAKISPTTIIKRSADNMNSAVSKKYALTPNDIETKSLNNKQFKTAFNFESIKTKSKQIFRKLQKYNKKIYSRKKKQFRELLNIGENVLVTAEQIKKKSAPGKFYKQTVQNILF